MPVLGVRLPWWLSFTSTAVLVLATLGVIVPGVIRHRSEEMEVTPCGRSHQDDVFKPQGYHSHLKVAGVPDGCECHFELSGDTKGELVVLMHGITASSAILRGVARELETLGFRVLNFDFFGRGHSSACLERSKNHFPSRLSMCCIPLVHLHGLTRGCGRLVLRVLSRLLVFRQHNLPLDSF
jgi:predicted alpha/beta-fold hydrolase